MRGGRWLRGRKEAGKTDSNPRKWSSRFPKRLTHVTTESKLWRFARLHLLCCYHLILRRWRPSRGEHTGYEYILFAHLPGQLHDDLYSHVTRLAHIHKRQVR
jgi:hypothetical protein